MPNQADLFSQVLADLEVDSSDMMTKPKDFVQRVIIKSKELERQLDAKSTLQESERTFKEKALKNVDAKAVAERIFIEIADKITEQDPEVLVHLLTLFPEITQTCASSIRSSSMRSGNVTALSKRQINLMYIKLKNTYETYVQFMKLFRPDDIGKPPVIPPKKGNYSDFSSSSGIKSYEFIVDGETWINPFAVAKKLGIEVKHYMDLPDKIREIQADDETALVNGHTVKLIDISQAGSDEE